MHYYFERDQNLEILIIENKSGAKYVLKENIGNVASSLSSSCVLKDQNSSLEVNLKIQAIKSETKHYNFKATLTSEDNKPDLKDQELYLIYKNFNDDANWRPVYKTEETKEMKFESTILAEDDLFLGDGNRKFRVELYSHSVSGLVAYAEVSINELEKNKIVSLKSGDSGSAMNTFLMYEIEFTEFFNFIELLQKGLQISLMVGVDFTGSNGDPISPASLHYLKGKKPNEYQRVISSCGSIIAHYDSDKNFPLVGFGGIPKGQSQTLHCFPLNFTNDPNVHGIEEMLNVYKNSVNNTKLSGPTLFAPLINTFTGMVKQSPPGTYFIYMILTDGKINDMQDTINSIVECSNYPVSIIIVGVGSADFSNMNVLDGDEQPLVDNSGRRVARDIVQFVPFRKFEGDGKKLSEEILKELPKQMELFYMQRKFI